MNVERRVQDLEESQRNLKTDYYLFKGTIKQWAESHEKNAKDREMERNERLMALVKSDQLMVDKVDKIHEMCMKKSLKCMEFETHIKEEKAGKNKMSDRWFQIYMVVITAILGYFIWLLQIKVAP